MARKKKEECAGIPGWLVSFGDLMSLLLTFFILLYSMSTVSTEKFFQSIRGLTEAFGGQKMVHESRTLIKNRVDLDFPTMHPKIKKKKQLLKQLTNLVEALKKEGVDAEVIDHGTRIIIRVTSKKIFYPASDKPTPLAKAHFMTLCKRLKESGFHIKIIGYTDSSPIKSPRFANNWELSIYRALNILKLFLQCGYDKRLLSAEGRGEYDPIAPNDTPQNRAKNRRVEFVIDLEGIS